MSDNTKIEWCDHTYVSGLLFMYLHMASITKCNAVCDLISQFRIIGKRLFMMGTKVPTTVFPTPLTRKVVPRKHIKSPPFIITRKPLAPPFRNLAIFVAVTVFATRGFCSCRVADFNSRFKRMCFPKTIAFMFFGRLAHFTARLFTHLFSFHGGNIRQPPCFPGQFKFFAFCTGTVATVFANCRKAVMSSDILCKCLSRNPRAAPVAPFQPSRKMLFIFFNSTTSFFGGSYHCAIFCLCH